jgi:hypothetical protein
LEANGIPTLCIASAWDIIAAGKPPRAVFVDYPLGHTTGKPSDSADQHDIVRRAIEAWPTITTPGEIVDLGCGWGEDDWRAEAASAEGDDQRSPRDETPRYQSEEDRRLAEAATGGD